MTESRYVSRKLHQFLLFCLALIILSSCYSVRLVNKDGVPEPDPLNQSDNFYKGLKVHTLDTTIRLKLTEGEFHLIERCPTGGFYSFEYRVTFGGVLLSAITFGKKRKVKIKYVCLKEQN
jgi:hypothetical protein